MDIEERNSGNKAFAGFKAGWDISMGVLYIILCSYAINLEFIIERFGKKAVYICCILFIFYGAFRIVRGFLAMKKSMKRKRYQFGDHAKNSKA
ncbi:MAG: hypothetical protein R2831_05035 [Chitinophagaceae bacterium]